MQTFNFPDATTFNGAVVMSHWGVVQAEGADAASFLHGQLSQDVSSLTPTEARLAAFCSVKGRMLANFLILRPQAESCWLLTDAQVLPGVLKRLSMFVMRAKARLSDASAAVSVIGLTGASAQAWLDDALPDQAWQVRAHGANGAQVVRLPDVLGAPRCVWIGPAEQASAVLATLPALPLASWQWREVMSGVVRIEPPTSDQFVPQMVNFEVVGGVNFKKGCYPGQEIVARSQYRGTLKRRMFLMHGSVPMQAGQEVFSATDPSQPAGLVANAAAIPGADGLPSAAYSALVELKWQVLEGGWHLGAADGPALMVGTLPYSVPMGESAD